MKILWNSKNKNAGKIIANVLLARCKKTSNYMGSPSKKLIPQNGK